MKLFFAAISLALSVMANAEGTKSIRSTAGGTQVIITELGLIPGGTFSSGLVINDQPTIVSVRFSSIERRIRLGNVAEACFRNPALKNGNGATAGPQTDC